MMIKIEKGTAIIEKEGPTLTSVSIPFDKDFPLLKVDFDVASADINVGGDKYTVDHLFTSDNGEWIVMMCYPCYISVMDMAKVAKDYYERLKAPSLVQGWDKYVATDGDMCMFVKSDYVPNLKECVFFLTTRNRETSCTLYKSKEK